MRSKTAVIVDAVRSPMGSGGLGGVLSAVPGAELLAQVLRALMDRNDLDPAQVDDVLVGCANEAVDVASTLARRAWRSAGLPEQTPVATIDSRSGSGQQPVHFAAQAVMAGEYDVVVVGGVESSHIGSVPSDHEMLEPMHRRHAPDLVPPGVSAELLAAKWKLTREQLDEYAVRSHRRASEVAAAGEFGAEIVPITMWTEQGRKVVTGDEAIDRWDPDRLAALTPAFESPGMRERFPEIRWRVTAGNTSHNVDGASAMLVMSERRAEELGLTPRARFVSFGLGRDDPVPALTAPIPATRKALARARLQARDIDHFEVNEAFAAVPLAWQAELDVNPDLLNPRGGAIALGHPRGASGARLMTTMLTALETTGGRYGLQTMCGAGGMANASIIERY